MRGAGDQVGVQVGTGQQGVIVEHFFKVGHQPAVIDAVTGKATADEIVHAALGHRFQGVDSQFSRALWPPRLAWRRRNWIVIAWGNLGAVPSRRWASRSWSRDWRRPGRGWRRPGRAGRRGRGVWEICWMWAVSLSPDSSRSAGSFFPDGDDTGEHFGEGGHAVAAGGREVGAAKEGLAVRV